MKVSAFLSITYALRVAAAFRDLPISLSSEPSLSTPSCVTDTCYSALLGAESSASSFCSSLLGTTTLTSLTTITSLATILQTSIATSLEIDSSILDQTVLSTLIDEVTVTSEIVILSTVDEIVSTAIETVTAQKRDVGTTLLKKRKVCPPKSSTTSSVSSIPPTTTSSTLVNPTDVCTASSQISSVCSCLGVFGAQTTVLQTSVFESTVTEVSTITDYLTITDVVTSIDSQVTTLFSTDLILDTSISTIIDELTLTETTSVSAPLVSSSNFILMVSSPGDSNFGQYLAIDPTTSGPTETHLTYVPNLVDAVQLQITSGGQLVLPSQQMMAYTNPMYVGPSGNELVFAYFATALLFQYGHQYFYMSGPGPYYVGSSGTLIPQSRSVSFCDCTSDVRLCSGTPTCGSAYTLSYLYV